VQATLPEKDQESVMGGEMRGRYDTGASIRTAKSLAWKKTMPQER